MSQCIFGTQMFYPFDIHKIIDGKISILDATEIQKYIAQLSSLKDEQLAVADVNGDGKISIIDATEIQRYIAQLIPSLG